MNIGQHPDLRQSWLLNALTSMFGYAASEFVFSPQLGARGTVKSVHGGERGEVPAEVIDLRDPILLMDCFRCASCGCRQTGRAKFGGRILVKERPRLGATLFQCSARTRSICDDCFGVEDPAGAVLARDEVLGFGRPEWQCGGVGCSVPELGEHRSFADTTLDQMATVAGIHSQPPVEAPQCPLCRGAIKDFDLFSGNTLKVDDERVSGAIPGRKRLVATCENGCAIAVVGADPS